MTKITLIGMYNFDSALFAGLELPEGVNKQTFIDSLLLSYGESPVLYPDCDFMKLAINSWGRKWYDSIARIVKALQEEYNPLHNYDRHEVFIEKRNAKNSGTDRTTVTNQSESEVLTRDDTTTRNDVSAYNQNDYTADSKNTVEGNVRNDATDRANGETNVHHGMATDEDVQHDGHLFGNIGVTTSAQMLTGEIDVRRNNNLYDILCSLFRNELLMYLF